MPTFHASLMLLAVIFLASPAFAQTELPTQGRAPNADVLTAEKWKQVDKSVERALAWLITQQQADGSFETRDMGQPAITSFGLMAFLAQGESPIDGKYQPQLEKAVSFIASQQKANGLISHQAPSAVPIPRSGVSPELGVAIVYNHAISSLALCEAYGQCGPEQSKKLQPVIEKAIAATLEMQGWRGKQKHNVGGWRYLEKHSLDSDLSVTGWQLMFLRSAKSAGFDVPKRSIDAGVAYVERSFIKDLNRQVYGYQLESGNHGCTRAMAGAGVLAMAHAGKHDSKEALASGEWILAHDFSNYNDDTPNYGRWLCDRYHYGAVLCSQAMYQLGGKYWEQFFPPLVDTLLANQTAGGAWPPEKREIPYGSCYSTSLCVLSLSVPNQLLPIFQR